MYRKIVYVFLLTFCMISCLEPYDVDIADYEDLLVVDALITDEAKNHRVYLSRSVPNLDETPQVESGALVIITDEDNNEEVLTEISPGVYETDKLQFKAKVGGTYSLSIRTSAGETYLSSPCTLLPPTSIDNVHFRVAKEWNVDETEELFGVNILVDGSSYDGGYVRWLYDEDWKFRVPFPILMEYNYELGDWEHVAPANVTCWKNSISDQVVIHSFGNQNSAELKDKKVCFVPSEVTDKLSVRYSILVKQLSISKEEYEFWNKLKISTEDVGDVFGTQPFSIRGNIKNVNNPKEPVLGYFQTGSAVTHRIYIDRNEIADLELPIIKYDHGCRVDSFIADGLSYNSPLEIYEALVQTGSYNLYDAIYAENSMAVIGLLLARPVCSDCTLTGNDQQPDFWED
ncbi:DUF4249 domain-containing protein [Carboxylicivirga sediminis]|uniref:DUF4249 domain-containing protein n=1 Tax=Carboxylicivirga sediminis TaxID=2006564 RepID=A0A941IYS4_9BACT|nr:DUF4249 domain-containing protein [Carboxylicivirga sediminis]MBR8536804.1 DUF4249 domain-containing protein [Carboxylicivirga sediminis]